MKSIAECAARHPGWVRPSLFEPHYELRAGEDLLGRLRLQGWLGRRALAECSDGAWRLERVGFLRKRMVARRTSDLVEAGRLEYNPWRRSGTFMFPDGRRFRLVRHIWQRSYEVTTGTDMPLLMLQLRGFFPMWGPDRVAAEVEIRPEALKISELPLFVFLSWYLVVLHKRDAAMMAGS